MSEPALLRRKVTLAFHVKLSNRINNLVCLLHENVLVTAKTAICRANNAAGSVMSESPRKPRNVVRFREREVARVTKAVREAGGGTVTLDPVTGQYTIQIANKSEVPIDITTDNPWDVRAQNEKWTT